METETPAVPSRRPRTWLLVLLGLVVIAAVAMSLRRSAVPGPAASNPARAPQQANGQRPDPTALQLNLGALRDPPPVPDDTDRNPFRFKPKPPPPEPPMPKTAPKPVVEPERPVIPQQPVVPPIPLKFIGITEAPGVGKIAALTDCRQTDQGREGELVYGRYRIVKIGVESLVIEYSDGKGRTTLRLNGQGCSGT